MKREEVIKTINYWRERSERPSLSGANLRQSDLSRTNLYQADMRRSNLCMATFYQANLRQADLRSADMQGADLYMTNLHRADLRNAKLQLAELYGADLYRANMRGANLSGADLSKAKNVPLHVYKETKIVPTRGDVIGWKKCRNNVIVKLLIPARARRCNATTRKCRAEYAIVIDVIGGDVGISWYDNNTEYRVGETVRCHNWNKNRWKECSGGIHFFLSKKEAEEWEL